jgi:uncharacterized membrane protein
MAELAKHRAHLDLQINLLTEQKVTKLLQVVDDLRGKLSDVNGDEADAQVKDLSAPTDPRAILEAIQQKSGS